MVDIDYIMELFDWNKTSEDQLLGIKLARDIKCKNVFFRPGNPYGERVWENCAKLLSEKSDDELASYLPELLEWLQDMECPGALCIFNRMKRYKKNNYFYFVLNDYIKYAKALKNTAWESNLREISSNQ